MQDDIFFGLMKQLEDSFEEMDSNITVALTEADAEYAALKKRLSDLEQQFPFLEAALEGDGELKLTAAEHAGLVEYLRVTNEAESRERLNLYLTGHRDCFGYLKRIGLI